MREHRNAGRLVALDRLSLPLLDPLRRYPMKMACGYLGLSHTSVYKKIKAGELRTIVDGVRRYVPGSEIVRLSRID